MEAYSSENKKSIDLLNIVLNNEKIPSGFISYYFEYESYLSSTLTTSEGSPLFPKFTSFPSSLFPILFSQHGKTPSPRIKIRNNLVQKKQNKVLDIRQSQGTT